MQFSQWLNEKRKNNVIVVDVQPQYSSWIKFDIGRFCEFLKEQGDILYFYNGPDTVGEDSEEDIKQWLLEESDYDEELERKLNQTTFIDKGYAFFRTWMDLGAETSFIIKAIRFMNDRKANDSRDISTEDWKEEFPDDWEDYMEGDGIYLPDISIRDLKKWSGSYIVGGGKDECLKELLLLNSVYNIKTKQVKNYIY